MKNPTRKEFLNTLNAAINYYDPSRADETALSKAVIDINNDTVKLELERLKRQLQDLTDKAREAEADKRKILSELAFLSDRINRDQSVIHI